MAKQLEEVRLVEGDLDDFDEEDIERWLASRMMPRWGQVVAWFVWELPWSWFVLLVGGLLWLTFSWTTPWKVAALISIPIAAFFLHARATIRNPFGPYVLVTRRPVPETETPKAPGT